LSHNIIISAIRSVRFTKPDGTEGTEPQREYFEPWQTPTSVTWDIVSASNQPAGDPLAVYVNWINSIDAKQIVEVYAEDDFWCEREPVDYEDCWPGRDHIRNLLEWIESVRSRGFIVQWESN
jgi:hypothetical protein